MGVMLEYARLGVRSKDVLEVGCLIGGWGMLFIYL